MDVESLEMNNLKGCTAEGEAFRTCLIYRQFFSSTRDKTNKSNNLSRLNRSGPPPKVFKKRLLLEHFLNVQTIKVATLQVQTAVLQRRRSHERTEHHEIHSFSSSPAANVRFDLSYLSLLHQCVTYHVHYWGTSSLCT